MCINNKWNHLQVRKVWLDTTGSMKIYSSFYFKSSTETFQLMCYLKQYPVKIMCLTFPKSQSCIYKKKKNCFKWILKGSFSEARHLGFCVFYVSLNWTLIIFMLPFQYNNFLPVRFISFVHIVYHPAASLMSP